MKLEEQVTSLEISKRLKELGVEQGGIYAWQNYSMVGWTITEIPAKEFEVLMTGGAKVGEAVSAFTVAELGEMLPVKIEVGEYSYFLWSEKDRGLETRQSFWNVVYSTTDFHFLNKETADTEADARGEMLIYLLENKLITL